MNLKLKYPVSNSMNNLKAMDQKVDLERLETIDTECPCGWRGLVLIDIIRDYFAICPKCQQKIYGLNCSKCESGFSCPANNKIINILEKTWRCEICKKLNELSEDANNNQAQTYAGEKDLPENIRQALKERRWRDRKITLPIVLLLASFVTVIIIFKVLPNLISLFRTFGF